MSVIEKPDESRELLHAPELRIAFTRITGVEVRMPDLAPGDGSWTMSGYAAVFDTDTVLYDGNFGRVVESVDPAAFNSVLASNPLTHFNFGHDMNRAMASTDVPAGQVGSLRLGADPLRGLSYLARVDPEDPDAQALAVKMRSGVIKGASFAFTIARQERVTSDLEDGREQEHVRILEVGELYDVCACAQGAYPTASSNFAARSYGAAILGLGQPTRVGVQSGASGQPFLGVREIVSPDSGVGPSSQLLLARLRAKARTSRTTFPDRNEA